MASASGLTCPVMQWCSISTTGRSQDPQTLHGYKAGSQTPNSKSKKLYTLFSFLIMSEFKTLEQPTQHMHRQIFYPVLECAARKDCFKSKSCSLLHPAIFAGEQENSAICMYLCNLYIVWGRSSWKFICCAACT